MKIKVFMLSHFFKNTYKHYCNLITECNNNKEKIESQETEITQLEEMKQSQEAEIALHREIKQSQEAEITQLREMKQNHEAEITQLRDIKQNHEAEITQLRDIKQNHEAEITLHREIKQNHEAEITLHREIKQSYEAEIIQLRDIKQSQEVEISELRGMLKNLEAYKLALSFLKTYILGNEKNDYNCINHLNYSGLHSIIEDDQTDSIEVFKIITGNIYKNNIEVIKNKSKIKVAFLATGASLWSCDPIYKRLASDSRFDTYIIVIPFEYGDDRTIIDNLYKETCEFFKAKKYKYIGAYDISNSKYLSFEDAGEPDIVFHLTPHTLYVPQNFQIDSLRLNVLNVYIPYGIMFVDGPDIQFNQKSHHLFWKIFCETPIHKLMARKYSAINDINVECSGYVKMDPFLDRSKTEEASAIWKVPEDKKGENEIIKVIWAPHHALVDHPHAFGTFHKNYLFFYELAKNNQEISWIVKPHPLLKKGSINFGVFGSPEEYDEYMRKWDELPNARTVHEGSYIDIFKTSDAMILDSVSFLSEYLFVQKPCLFLTKPCDSFNEFGSIVKECHYKVDGEDLEGIKHFIYEVLIKKNDIMKDKRKDIFNKYLNYLNFNNGILASNYIYRQLKKTLSNDN